MTKVPAQARQRAVTANLPAEQRAWKSTGSTLTIIPQTCIFKVASLASKTNLARRLLKVGLISQQALVHPVGLIKVDAEPLQLSLHLIVLQTDLNQVGVEIAPFDDTLVHLAE